MSVLPSGSLPYVAARTSKLLATLKRMFGISSVARCNSGSMMSDRMMSMLRDGAMVYWIVRWAKGSLKRSLTVIACTVVMRKR